MLICSAALLAKTPHGGQVSDSVCGGSNPSPPAFVSIAPLPWLKPLIRHWLLVFSLTGHPFSKGDLRFSH
jgi:hypothetical protein